MKDSIENLKFKLSRLNHELSGLQSYCYPRQYFNPEILQRMSQVFYEIQMTKLDIACLKATGGMK